MHEKDYLIWLKSIKGVGNKTLENLLKYFKSAEYVYKASADELLKLKGINHNIVHNIINNRDSKKILEQINNTRKYNIDILDREDKEYPENLKHIYDPPFILFKKGNILSRDMNAIAIVGARKASAYGKYVAYKFASDLAKKGITVVSGMAYGIDTMAHKGALENGGRTIAILGCGLDICYPKSNHNLMKEIEKNGAILSEYGVGTKPLPINFPARNRIISGISKGVIVIEANINSGSLITAEFALDQGREVFAVPGNINSSLSMGTNKLIQDGAKLVTDIDDVLEELNMKVDEDNNKELIQLSDTESEVYKAILANQPIHIELLFKELRWNISNISSIITILQLKGLVEQLPGNLLIAK
ncbi:DNA-protecting protein DprA [Crassaminicella thermophila]|uniref:DNA-protecting protein DprA n=1 Tax=Crassaminicella thermophila TaxID=2599308 RepID=A0A5C0SGC1_CRATE|nr:DNA-processing protein DprA [Crassaminicella thermophila]QEK13625.1 DNA-protecting protein DprA [Crassaminicella thermophila]